MCHWQLWWPSSRTAFCRFKVQFLDRLPICPDRSFYISGNLSLHLIYLFVLTGYFKWKPFSTSDIHKNEGSIIQLKPWFNGLRSLWIFNCRISNLFIFTLTLKMVILWLLCLEQIASISAWWYSGWSVHFAVHFGGLDSIIILKDVKACYPQQWLIFSRTDWVEINLRCMCVIFRPLMWHGSHFIKIK